MDTSFSFGNFLHDWLTLEGGPTMPLFGLWHILFDIIIFGSAFTVGILCRNKNESVKSKILNGLVIALVCLYIFDFFMGPLWRDREGTIDKLPFHVCTVMCPLTALSRIFYNQFSKVRMPIAVLSLVGSLMYMTYPGSAIGEGSYAFSYVVLQTFLYHGVLFTFGFLSIAFGDAKIDIKKFWIMPLAVLVLMCWAFLGNYTYNYIRPYDWFFVMGGLFSFIPEKWMHVYVFGAVSLMCLIIFGLTYAIDAIRNKIEAKQKVEVAE